MCSSLGYPAGRLCTDQPDLLDPGNASLKQDQSDGAVPSSQLMRAFGINPAGKPSCAQGRNTGSQCWYLLHPCQQPLQFIHLQILLHHAPLCSPQGTACLLCLLPVPRHRPLQRDKETESPQHPPSTGPEPCCALGSRQESFAEGKQPGMLLRKVLCQAPQLQSTSKERAPKCFCKKHTSNIRNMFVLSRVWCRAIHGLLLLRTYPESQHQCLEWGRDKHGPCVPTAQELGSNKASGEHLKIPRPIPMLLSRLRAHGRHHIQSKMPKRSPCATMDMWLPAQKDQDMCHH